MDITLLNNLTESALLNCLTYFSGNYNFIFENFLVKLRLFKSRKMYTFPNNCTILFLYTSNFFLTLVRLYSRKIYFFK